MLGWSEPRRPAPSPASPTSPTGRATTRPPRRPRTRSAPTAAAGPTSTSWCADHRLEALPAEPPTVALYLAQLGGKRKASTIQQRVSAIAQAHKTAGHPSPTQDQAVRLVLAGIRRTHGTAQEGKAAAVTADLRRMVDALPVSVPGVTDRALLP